MWKNNYFQIYFLMPKPLKQILALTFPLLFPMKAINGETISWIGCHQSELRYLAWNGACFQCIYEHTWPSGGAWLMFMIYDSFVDMSAIFASVDMPYFLWFHHESSTLFNFTPNTEVCHRWGGLGWDDFYCKYTTISKELFNNYIKK